MPNVRVGAVPVSAADSGASRGGAGSRQPAAAAASSRAAPSASAFFLPNRLILCASSFLPDGRPFRRSPLAELADRHAGHPFEHVGKIMGILIADLKGDLVRFGSGGQQQFLRL